MRSHLAITLTLLPGLLLAGCGQAPGGSVAYEAVNDAGPAASNERYDGHPVSPIHQVAAEPVSTFAVDVDTGAYANVRRMLLGGQAVPAEAVRTEEMINYFRYDYPLPDRPLGTLQRYDGGFDDAVECRHATVAHRPARL